MREKLLAVLTVLFISHVSQAEGKCQSFFGPYSMSCCHCTDGCSDLKADSTRCPSGCVLPWRGPACQRENVAYGKPAERSSVLNSDKRFWGSRSVDGNLTTRFSSKKQHDPWVLVDMKNPTYVYAIHIFNYNQSRDAISGFVVDVSNRSDFMYSDQCYKDTRSRGQAVYRVTCTKPMVGRYVRIIVNRYTTLSIQCAKFWFGAKCGRRCNCLDTQEDCDKLTGQCDRGCLSGFMGTDCYQECPDYTFGLKCSSSCNCRDKTEVCDKDSGRCSSGCEAGRSGLSCQDECTQGTFGLDCSSRCHCRDKTEVCNKGSGGCTSGCEAGRAGPSCQDECTQGTFGLDCSSRCHCRDKAEVCNKASGGCNSGCEAGRAGPSCQDACADGTFGLGCSKICRCVDANEVCSKVHGHCFNSGCPKNRKGDGCQDCTDGYFQPKCQKCACSDSSEVCDQATRLCTSGCSDGKMGPGCLLDCGSQRYGPNCRYACHCLKSENCRADHNSQCSSCQRGYTGSKCNIRNVALNQRTEQSFTQDSTRPSSRAVDGSTSGSNYLACTSASGQPTGFSPWWKVYLDHDTWVNQIRVYNRADGHNYELAGFTIYIGNRSQERDLQLCYHHKNEVPPQETIARCNNSLVGDVLLLNKSRNDNLYLCEVEIFECLEYFFGENCTSLCNCRDPSEVCDRFTGSCNSGCKIGYTGTGCQSVCLGGKFGQDCKLSCHCLTSNDDCDTVNGRCPNGTCASGFMGESCQEACKAGMFGQDCKNECNCANGEKTCDKGTGNCQSGCAAGFTGPSCLDACKAGRFGQDCKNECNCANGEKTCDKGTGNCPSGCAAGFTGPSCLDECPGGSFGASCSMICNCLDYASCDKTHGACRGGCAEGWTGQNCHEKQRVSSGVSEEDGEGDTVGTTAGVVIGVLIPLIIGGVILVLFLLRWRKRKQACRDGNVLFSNRDGDLAPSGEANQVRVAVQESVYRANMNNVPDEPAGAVGGNEDTYANSSGIDGPTTSIHIQDLQMCVRQKLIEKILESEFQKLPAGLQGNHDAAQKSENIGKCRYKGILPYDHSRVVLDKINNDPSTDFINASHIDGYNKKRAYIASQGPTALNLNDFWRMVWEENASKIVMLTNLCEGTKVKVEQYWPDKGVQTYGKIEVETTKMQQCFDFCIRTLVVKKVGEVREVKQFHYQDWPDHDVPLSTLGIIAFRDKVNQTSTGHHGPLIVHCSAGVGRSGTYIAYDYLMDQLQRENNVNLFQCVSDMRRQRTLMVQTPDQYVYLHKLVCDAVQCSEATISADHLLRMDIDSDDVMARIAREYKTLNAKLAVPWNTPNFSSALSSENIDKNRDKQCIAGRSNYINAVYIAMAREHPGLIVTQMPLEHTVVDFWRLIHERSCTTVIMLNELEEDETGIYWPSIMNTAVFGPFEVSLKEESRIGPVKLSNLSVVCKRTLDNAIHIVKQFCFNDWGQTMDNVPRSPMDILKLKDAIDNWQHLSGNNQTIVQCRNGSERSGLFCACWEVLEKLRGEQSVNIMLIVKRLRTICPNAITSEESDSSRVGSFVVNAQYRFCYRLAKAYLEDFHTYVNLT